MGLNNLLKIKPSKKNLRLLKTQLEAGQITQEQYNRMSGNALKKK